MRISIVDGMSVYSIDRYQNVILKAMLLHVLKQVQLQERFALMTHDSFGHLKTLFMNKLSLSIALNMNRNLVAHRSALKKTLSVRVWIQLYVNS